MTKTVRVCEKGKLCRSKYVGLTDQEKELKRGDIVQCAYEDQRLDFEFHSWLADGSAYCWLNGGRVFYGDAVKKSSRQIKREKQSLRKGRRLAKKFK